MRVLSLSLDNLVFDSSAVAERMVAYGELVEKYIVVVPGKKVREINLSNKASAYCSGGSNKFFQLFRTCKLSRKLFREFDFDVITVQDQYFLGLMGLRLSKKFKVGLEIQIHGFEKFFGIRKVIARFVIPRANSIRVVSERLKQRLINEFGVKEEKITVVPIFSDIKFQTSNFRHQEKDKFVFLTVGRLVAIKNISLQIEVFKSLLEKFKNIELRIIGSGPDEDNLKKLAGENRQIKFFPWQDNLEQQYKEADAFLLTSNYEGWGMVIIEAASFALPIVMTDVGCAREVIKNNESGLVIPVGDQEKLKQAMTRLIEDENLREKLGQGARAAISRLPNKQETFTIYKKSWKKALSN